LLNIANLEREIKRQNSLVAEQAVKIANLQNEIEIY
jgi:hypothetical protein